jgi:hypothetical protein
MRSGFLLAKSTHEPKVVSHSVFVRPVRPNKRRILSTVCLLPELNYRHSHTLNLLQRVELSKPCSNMRGSSLHAAINNTCGAFHACMLSKKYVNETVVQFFMLSLLVVLVSNVRHDTGCGSSLFGHYPRFVGVRLLMRHFQANIERVPCTASNLWFRFAAYMYRVTAYTSVLFAAI